MKKVMVVSLFLCFCVSMVSAQIFVGSRQAGMGGTGVASAVGLNAVAYNPAGLMRGPSGEFLLSLGAASQGFDQIAQSAAKFTDPAQFMIDNYGTKLDANGTISGIIGLNINHVGLSILMPSVMATLSKPANTLAGSVTALGLAEFVLTLGQSYSIPGVPIGTLDVGVNLKGISVPYGNLTILSDPTSTTPMTATQTVVQGSGTGVDIGAKTTIDIPMVSDFSVGIAMQNISETINYKPKTRTDTYTITPPSTTPTLNKGTETEGAGASANAPTTTVFGCAGTVPGVGLKFAADIESISGGTGILAAASETVTHLGLEYPLLMNTLIVRAGTASSPSISYTTLGAKINVPFLTLEIANVIDNKNSKNTSYVIDAGFAF